MIKLLIVNDDVGLGVMLKKQMELAGFVVDIQHDKRAVAAAVLHSPHAVAVFEVKRFASNDIEILRQIQEKAQTPAHTPAEAEREIVVGALSIRPAQRTAQCGGVALELTSAEFNILKTLAQNAGRVVNKADISQQGLGRALVRYDRSIDVHVSSLRQKLGVLDSTRSWIQNVRGVGYQLLTD